MKNTILMAMFHVNLALFILAGCSLDSSNLKPLSVLIVTGAWLVSFGYANRDYKVRG